MTTTKKITLSRSTVTIRRYRTFFSFDTFIKHSALGATFDDQPSAVEYARDQLASTRYQTAKVIDSTTDEETRIP